jgi:hypothetical protein
VAYYNDIRPIISDLNYAQNIHELEAAKRGLDRLCKKYLSSGYTNWQKSDEAKGIHTWAWGEIRPMLTNSKAEIDDFERRYGVHPDTVIETTSNSQNISGWEIKMLEVKPGQFNKVGIIPVIKQTETNLTISEAREK